MAQKRTFLFGVDTGLTRVCRIGRYSGNPTESSMTMLETSKEWIGKWEMQGSATAVHRLRWSSGEAAEEEGFQCADVVQGWMAS